MAACCTVRPARSKVSPPSHPRSPSYPDPSPSQAHLRLFPFFPLVRTTRTMPITRSTASRSASAPTKSLPTLLRSSSEPLPPLSTASSSSTCSPRSNSRPVELKRRKTFAAKGGKRLAGGGGGAAKAQVSLVVVYAVFATCGTDEAVRRYDGVEDESDTRATTDSSSPPSSPSFEAPSLVLTPPSSPSLSPRAPPSSLAFHSLQLPLLRPPSLTAIGIDLARCHLRACTCSPDYDSGETTSSDEERDER